MKALTLTLPWPVLMWLGEKLCETRGWPTDYRGLVAIHAGKGLGPVGGEEGLRSICFREPYHSALSPLLSGSFNADLDFPRGAVVAVGVLVDCVPTEKVLIGPQRALRRFEGGRPVSRLVITDREREFGDYTPGRFAWVFSEVRALVTPYAARGAQRLFDIDLSDADLVYGETIHFEGRP